MSGSTGAAPIAAGPWHTLTATDAERAVGSGPAGLSPEEAARRLLAWGANAVEEAPGEPLWAIALHQFRDPLIYILLVAGAVTLALRDFTDAAVIVAVIVINAAIGLVQEARASREMRALARLSAPHAQVVRGGAPLEIPSRELVVGDLVLLASGARVPADLRIVQARDLALDESVLTGESLPTEKHARVLGEPALTVGDQANMAFAGTTVARGRGRGVVVRTGGSTELGRIASAMREVGRPATPMEEAFARFGRLVGAVIVALAVVVLGLGLARGMAPADIFLTAVAMAVSAIPEGLPVVLTITLAVGVRRMARRRAIVRALPAVETLGSTTVIGSDKTGTLTKNEMTVRAIWAGGRRFDVTGVGYAADGEIRAEDGAVRATADRALLATLSAAVLASEADPSERGMGKAVADPTELALFAVASKGGVDPVALRRSRAEVDLLPFESDRQYMVSLRESEGGLVEHLKGAPEVVLALCTRQLGRDGEEEPVDREAALGIAAAFAGEGLRVLAMAYRPSTTPAARRIAEPTHRGGFVLAGLVGMEDPVRPEAIQAVADARSAGVRVLMLTGDHVGTARVIGRRLGLGERAVTGSAIARATDDALDRVLGETNVFARVAPEHKLRIVQRLRAAGEVVAVTGDGVNDAPALRAAHLGIAMGASGSDVAREASDMVLADDDFATITAAIEEGRVVFANIRKATFFLLSTAVGEVLSILVALLAGWPVPFTAAQILWINLVTDSLQVMALAFEPGEPGLMRDPPRPRGTGVLTSRLVVRLGGVGLVLTAVTLGTFWWTLRTTGDMTTARTAALTQMVVLQFYHVFNCRSLDRSLFTISPLSNRFLFVSMVAVAVAHLAAVYAAPLQVVLRTTALGGEQWGVILVAGLAVVAGGELDKAINRRTRHRLG